MFLKIKSILWLYIVFCICSLFFIDSNNLLFEAVFKLLAIISLSVYYIGTTKQLDKTYLLILFSSILSDVFLVFDNNFLLVGSLLLLSNRILYLIILKNKIIKIEFRSLLLYIIPFFVVFFLVIALVKYKTGQMFYLIFITGLLSTLMASLSFYNYVSNATRKNMLLFFGLILIIVADIVATFNQFISYQLFFAILSNAMYYVARYFICYSIIKKEIQ